MRPHSRSNHFELVALAADSSHSAAAQSTSVECQRATDAEWRNAPPLKGDTRRLVCEFFSLRRKTRATSDFPDCCQQLFRYSVRSLSLRWTTMAAGSKTN